MEKPSVEQEILYMMQGLEGSSNYRNALKWVLELSEIEKCIISSAYADSRGVGLVLDGLIPIAEKVSVYLGINNGSTTFEAIRDLIESGIRVVGVDTSSRETIFHQKTYISWNAHTVRIVMGSANLTHHGLLQNFEGGFLLELNISKGFALRDQIVDSLEVLHKRYPKNLIAFNESNLSEYIGLLLTQEDRKKKRLYQEKIKNHALNPPMRPTIDPDSGYQWPIRIANTPDGMEFDTTVFQEEDISKRSPIWTQKISSRHISVKTSSNTHITGDFNLGKGKAPGLVFVEDKDFQTYYRKELFAHLDWSVNTKTGKEEAEAWFNIVIDDNIIGAYRLTITFTQSIRTVEENNTTTAIRWGKNLLPIVSKPKYIDGTMSLFASEGDEDFFTIQLTSKTN